MSAAWIDISVPVREGMVHWPDDPPVEVRRVQALATGDEANLTHLAMSAHTGTHVDAPVHFLREGAGIDELPLDVARGAARVVELDGPGPVREQDLRAHGVDGTKRLLLKTRNSRRRWWEEEFDQDYVHLVPDAAAHLASLHPPLLGVDYLSVGGPQNGAETHRHLLGAGIWIIEGLDLTGIDPGEYELICLPIRIAGADGAPARALVRPAG